MLTAVAPAFSLLVPASAARALRYSSALGELTVAVGAALSKLNWRLGALVTLVPLGAALSVVVTTIVYVFFFVMIRRQPRSTLLPYPSPFRSVIAVAPALLALKVEPLVQKPLASPVFCSLMLT